MARTGVAASLAAISGAAGLRLRDITGTASSIIETFVAHARSDADAALVVRSPTPTARVRTLRKLTDERDALAARVPTLRADRAELASPIRVLKHAICALGAPGVLLTSGVHSGSLG